MLEVGERIDRYEVEARIGEGGMASVYRVRHVLLGSPHALKVLRPEYVADDDLRARFFSEGRIQAQLHHPHIAAVTDLVVQDGVAGLVMELLEGRTLEERMAGGPLPASEAFEVLAPVLAAVDHAHWCGIVHRDLKPSNVFLCERTRGMVRPVVLDFGIARIEEDSRLVAFQERQTQVGTRMGTVQYMSPEQVQDASIADARSDIFALASIVHEVLTGVTPFQGDSDYAVMQAIVEGTMLDPAQRMPEALHGVAGVLRTALATDPMGRYQDVPAFRAALRGAWPTDVEVVVSPDLAPEQAVEPEGFRRTVVEGASLIKDPGTALERRFVLTSDEMMVEMLEGKVEKYRPIRYGHARFRRDEKGWRVVPQRRAKVWVDGRAVDRPTSLRGGEAIRIETYAFRFRTS